MALLRWSKKVQLSHVVEALGLDIGTTNEKWTLVKQKPLAKDGNGEYAVGNFSYSSAMLLDTTHDKGIILISFGNVLEIEKYPDAEFLVCTSMKRTTILSASRVERDTSSLSQIALYFGRASPI
ncbi:hypothetical protein ACHAWF_008330 [Thalassiosira exigua]